MHRARHRRQPGIGAATVGLCAQHGYAVAVNCARDEVAVAMIVDRIRDAGGRAIAVQAEVADEDQVLAVDARIDAELPPLYGLVNNAGIVDREARVDEMSVARLERMFRVNVIGSFVCAREAVKRLSTRHGHRGGAIVNVGQHLLAFPLDGVIRAARIKTTREGSLSENYQGTDEQQTAQRRMPGENRADKLDQIRGSGNPNASAQQQNDAAKFWQTTGRRPPSLCSAL